MSYQKITPCTWRNWFIFFPTLMKSLSPSLSLISHHSVSEHWTLAESLLTQSGILWLSFQPPHTLTHSFISNTRWRNVSEQSWRSSANTNCVSWLVCEWVCLCMCFFTHKYIVVSEYKDFWEDVCVKSWVCLSVFTWWTRVRLWELLETQRH